MEPKLIDFQSLYFLEIVGDTLMIIHTCTHSINSDTFALTVIRLGIQLKSVINNNPKVENNKKRKGEISRAVDIGKGQDSCRINMNCGLEYKFPELLPGTLCGRVLSAGRLFTYEMTGSRYNVQGCCKFLLINTSFVSNWSN